MRSSAATRCCWTTGSSTGSCAAGGRTSCWWTASSPSATSGCSRAAPLREPPSHLARASTIFITKSDGNTEELRRRIAELNPDAGIIECVHHPLYLEDVFTGERFGLDFLKGRKVASLSGIAQPESFEQSLVKLGAELVYSPSSPITTGSPSRRSSM